MSQTVDEILHKSGVGSLDDLKDKLKNGTSQSTALLQALEQIEDADDTTSDMFNTLPLLASDISDEHNQKQTQKKLREIARTIGLERDPSLDLPFGSPGKDTPSR